MQCIDRAVISMVRSREGERNSSHIDHEEDSGEGYHCCHLVHVGLFLGDEVQEGEDAAECLVVYHQDCQHASHGKGPTDLGLHDAVEEQVRQGHSDVGHVSMIKLHHRNIFEEITPQGLAFLNQPIGHHLPIHQWPSIVPTSMDDYILPASIPATNAPVRMLSIRHFIMMMPINLMLFRYLSLATSLGSTYVGFINRLKAFQSRPEQRTVAMPRCVARRYGLTLGLF